VTASSRTSATQGVWALLSASGVSVTGDGVIAAAVPLLAATITRDPIAISLVTVASYLPWILVGLVAGVLSDRWPRRATMIAADLVRAALLAGLSLLTLSQHATVPMLAGVVFLVGCGQCFFDAASQAIVPTLVGRNPETLARVNSRVWALDTFGRQLVGPPAGAAMFSVFPFLPFFLDAVSFIASAVILRRLPTEPIRPSGNHPRTGAAIRDGISHILNTPPLYFAATHTALFNFGFNAAITVLVLFAEDDLGLSEAEFGLLLAVMAVGGIIGSQVAPFLTRRFPMVPLYAAALVVAAGGWTAVGLAPNLVGAAAGLAAVGVAAMLGSVVIGTQRQLHTPDQMLGRVVSAFRLAGLGGAGLGALAGGMLARWVGPASPFFVAAALLPVAALVFLALRRRACRPSTH
jgi:MFS family permease